MKRIFHWSVIRLAKTVEEMQRKKFDCIIIIEGNRGLGKSTLGYKICRATKSYKFKPKKDILYRRDQVIDAFNDRWYSTFMADEMINVSFNRDFFDSDQKKLIKIINMNRDHYNLFIACVPSFRTLDTQIKQLCKIRITIVRRGLAIVQTQNRSIYSVDRWDSAINEKIEKEWIIQGKKPRYSRLTTFRGLLKFHDLTPRQREEYEEIKREQRNIIKREEALTSQSNNPNQRIFVMLKDGKIPTRELFDQLCIALGMKPLTVLSWIRTQLINQGERRRIAEFFYEDVARQLDTPDKFMPSKIID